MISIKGARTAPAAITTPAAVVLVLPGGVEDIIRPDDLVQKITAFPVLAAGRQVEIPAGLRAVLVVRHAHGGAVLPLLPPLLLPAVTLLLHALRHARHACEVVK